MILVTGATGFIGRSLVRHLSDSGYALRTLIRPSRRTPRLPIGVPLEVAVVSLADTRGLRAALHGVDYIFHLAGAESQGRHGNLYVTDIQGTQNLAEAAVDAGVERLIYLSHLGADRASAFPLLKAKGIAEEHIRSSGVAHTILRSSIVFGPEDHFTTGLVRMLRAAPGILPLPGGGRTVVQPLWVEDLVTCMVWALENPATLNQTYEVGGSEFFTLRQIVETLMSVIRVRRLLVPLSIPTLRALTVALETFVPGFPASSFWLDYFAVSRTCPVENLPRLFGLMPARFTYRLDYLIRRPWYLRLWQRLSDGTARAAQGLRSLRRPR